MRLRQPPPPLPRRPRGQPLVMLALLLLGWAVLRGATWVPLGFDTAQAAPSPASSPAPAFVTAPSAAPPQQETALPAAPAYENAPLPRGFADPTGWRPAPPPSPLPATTGAALPARESLTTTAAQRREKVAAATARRGSPRMAAGHTLLAAAGFAQMRVPPELAAYFTRASLPPAPALAPALHQAPSVPAAPPAPLAASVSAERTSRWSADGWLLWRDDTTTPLTSGRPSYGRSQLGAVVRYALAPSSGHRPQAYLRGAAALQGVREAEAATGLSARPLPGVPVRVAAELRVGDRAAGTTVRPAAYAVTEFAPQRMPGGLVGEAYAQAGYVAGEGRTAFADGQARIERPLAAGADFDLRAGAAAWGGAQRGGARLDVGPTASLGFRLGEARGRVAADYRFRVAGDAEPASGPALTLSAGF